MGTHKIYSGIQGIRDNISGSLYGYCHELLAPIATGYGTWVWSGTICDVLHEVHTLFEAVLEAGPSLVTSWASWASLVGKLNFSYLHSQY